MAEPGQVVQQDQTSPPSVECVHEDLSRFAGMLREGIPVEICRPCRVREFQELRQGLKRFPGVSGEVAVWLNGMTLGDLERGMVIPWSDLAIRGEVVRARPASIFRLSVRKYGRGAQRGNAASTGVSCSRDWPPDFCWPVEPGEACRSGKDHEPFLALEKLSGQASRNVCARVFGLGSDVPRRGLPRLPTAMRRTIPERLQRIQGRDPRKRQPEDTHAYVGRRRKPYPSACAPCLVSVA